MDAAADEVEAHIGLCLAEFQSEFVELRCDAFTREGRHLRASWKDPVVGPDGKAHEYYHELSFRVRRYHDYADVEVEVKMIVSDSERRRRTREEDVHEGDPSQLFGFVERQILDYTKLYAEQRSW